MGLQKTATSKQLFKACIVDLCAIQKALEHMCMKIIIHTFLHKNCNPSHITKFWRWSSILASLSSLEPVTKPLFLKRMMHFNFFVVVPRVYMCYIL